MSKSLGNLVLVSQLVDDGTDPRAIRLAILAQHYRSSWEFTDEVLEAARARLRAWQEWSRLSGRRHGTLTDQLRKTLAHDLDTPAAIALIDSRIAARHPPGGSDLDSIDALLGIRL